MSTQAYPDTTLIDVIEDKFAYEQEHTDRHDNDCENARRHNWWRTSLFTNEEDRTSTGRYICSECMERATIELDLPSEDDIKAADNPTSVIVKNDRYKSMLNDERRD